MPIPGYLPGHKVHRHSVTHAACGATGAAYTTATAIASTKVKG